MSERTKSSADLRTDDGPTITKRRKTDAQKAKEEAAAVAKKKDKTVVLLP